ncbi:MAG TPA: hypothetical protein VGO86_04325 [Candidatus Dormibacteraeota bacterium]|jgi:hypothetical protein
MIARVWLPLAAGAAQVAAALVVLGLPGWAAAWDFFASREPTFASALAASRLTVLLIALGLLISALVRALRLAARGIAERRRQTVAGAAVLATGLLILAAGLSHHMGAPSVVLGAGSVKEASQELAR